MDSLVQPKAPSYVQYSHVKKETYQGEDATNLLCSFLWSPWRHLLLPKPPWPSLLLRRGVVKPRSRATRLGNSIV